MKEDILEQLIEDWFIAQTGYFVKHNIKYRPSHEHDDYNSKRDSVHSDIDILAVSNIKKGLDKVLAVTCKSWQDGFKCKYWIKELENEATYNERSSDFKPREKWKYFRELVSDKWMEAFIDKIEGETGQRDFTYIIALTKISGPEEDRKLIEKSEILVNRFKAKRSKVKVKMLTLKEIIDDYSIRIKDKKTTSLEPTDVGRLLQLINAAGLEIVEK